MRKINKIFIHCAATKTNMDIGADQIRDWHVDGNGWSDIGYHDVIKFDGTIEAGRPEEKSGAHAKGYNSDSLGVCLIGGMAYDGSPTFNFTFKQLDALRYYLNAKMGEHGLSIDDIYGHCDVDSGKTCPNFDVKQLLKYGI